MASYYKGVTPQVFNADQFFDYADAGKYEARVPSDTYRATGKAKFANALEAFILAGFPRQKFTKSLYRSLTNCFGHIAHYDIDGFYATWFSTAFDREQFLRNIIQSSPCGSPEYTYVDVERQVKVWVKNSGIYEAVSDASVFARSLATSETALDALRKLSPEARAKVLASL